MNEFEVEDGGVSRKGTVKHHITVEDGGVSRKWTVKHHITVHLRDTPPSSNSNSL